MALQYVESQRQARPDLADWYADLADLYQRKLWHQLTLKLDQFLQLQPAQVRPRRLLFLLLGKVHRWVPRCITSYDGSLASYCLYSCCPLPCTSILSRFGIC